MEILTIERLSKRFATTQALDEVSFTVEKGDIFGILGPNGAGKTTFLRILNNIIIPDSGDIRINGEPVTMATSCHFGYMPEERGLYDRMTVQDQIMYFGTLKGGDRRRMREVMKEYMDIFHLTPDAKRKVKELSKGNQQKVQIISTLVHEPQVVVLDEPFSGFDPINGALLQDLVRRLQEREATIILSSHNMPAIEEMCQSIALLNKGHLLLNGHIDDLKEANRNGRYLVTVAKPLHQAMLTDADAVTSVSEVSVSGHRKGHTYEIEKAPGHHNMDILQAVSMQADILHFEEKLPSLNDLFLKYTTSTSPQQ